MFAAVVTVAAFAGVVVAGLAGSLVFVTICNVAAVLLFAAVIIIVVVFALVVRLVVGVVERLGVGGGVVPAGALAGVGEWTFVAVFAFADVDAGSKLVACGCLLHGLDGFGVMRVLLAIDELRGNL